jgi:hypothetical protein
MRLTIYYSTGDVLQLDCVQSMRLVGPMTVETQTFGNAPVQHRSVDRVEAEFEFVPTALGRGLDDDALPLHARRMWA